MIWSFISYLIASLLLHCCMSLALLPGTSPIACAAVDVGGPRKKRCVFVPYARATELVVSGLCHTTLSHTLFQTQLSNAPSFTHNFVTHSLAQTTFTHTIFLCQAPSFKYSFVTHTIFFYQLFTYIFFTSRSFTSSFVFPSFPVPLQHVLLITGRSWLVGLSGPLILPHCFLTMFSR